MACEQVHNDSERIDGTMRELRKVQRKVTDEVDDPSPSACEFFDVRFPFFLSFFLSSFFPLVLCP